MKKILLLVCSAMLCTSIQAADFETAKDAVKNMGVGWNLGNTLDAADASKTWTTTAQHETYWGQPVTKPELMKMMKEAGFGAIRVPITWYQEMDKDGKVNDAWMNRVKEVVDYVIDNGMYCIINVHHDTGDGTQWLHASTTNYNTNKAKYEGLWKQIAEKFKDYDQKLLFEAYNEMLDDKNTWNEPLSDDGYQAINNYAKSFVTTVRNTGGNNKDRNLIVNTYSASSAANAMKALDLPEESGHIIFELHSYPNWKSESNAKIEIDNLINIIKTNLLNRAPVIIGEYATFTTWPANLDYYTTDKKVAFYAMDYLIKQTKENGIGTFYWMGLSDGDSRSLPAFNQADLAQTLIKAYYGSTDGYKFPTADDFQITYIVKYVDDWSEAFLFGDWGRATQKLSDYKGIRLEMDNDYSGKLQMKIYGDKDGKNDDGSDKYKEQYTGLTAGSNTTEVTFDTSILGSTFWGVTLQTLAGAMTAKVKKASLIKADGSEVSLTVSKAWGCEVSSESSPSSGIRSISATLDKGEGYIYNLNGQRMTTPRKGIYIQNGKKYILK
ncbi:MAG: cellulase family glycosylhydrolase [Prevotella sp.]|nr:cellulase family glycosylhydrolase [Prevotella sp.]MBR0264037.1 cellulase family glycosylhydrolase [Prevotella sp.]